MEFQNWGLIEYKLALEKQQALVEEVLKRRNKNSPSPGIAVFCSHPPVVTVGRKTQGGDIFGWTGEVVEVNRGGRATYHGPSQLVMYPIFDLTKLNPKNDVVEFLRSLEKVTVQSLAKFGIEAFGKTQNQIAQLEDTGVWVGARKIASLGIAVRQWISFHGLAINLQKDPAAFQGLNPCGYSSSVMTSLEEISEVSIPVREFERIFKQELDEFFTSSQMTSL